MLNKPVCALALATSLAACSTVQVAETGEVIPDAAVIPYESWPAQFAGQSLEVRTASGVTNVANLAPDGTLRLIPELSTVAVKGTWGTRGEALCTNVPQVGEDCWAYAPVLAANGDWVKLQSSSGKVLNVRLLSEAEEDLLEKGG